MRKNFDVALRGHHLMALCIFYFLGGEIKIWLIAYFRYGYNERTTKHLISRLKKITESNIRVKIINTLDDICKRCNIKESSCSGPRKAKRDTKIAKEAGLEINKIYSSKYILKQLKTLSRNKRSIFYLKTVRAKL